jgi:hypothetical protein
VKQYQQVAKTTTGLNVKKGQANSAVHSKSNSTLEAQLGQYFFLPSLIETYRKEDPSGTYLIEYTNCAWDSSLKQFDRAYFACGFSKHFWKNAKMPIYFCDGTFTKLKGFKHILLIATTFDGNNEIVVLAFAMNSRCREWRQLDVV